MQTKIHKDVKHFEDGIIPSSLLANFKRNQENPIV